MKKFFFAIIKFLSGSWGKFSKLIFGGGFRDDGKWMKPKIVLKVIIGLPLIILLTVVFIRYVINPDGTYDHLSRFDKESEIEYNKGGIAAISDLNDEGRMDLEYREEEENSTASSNYISDALKSIPSRDRCQTLLNRASKGIVLSAIEKEELQKCLDNNILGLTADQKKALEMLMDPNADLTDAERALLRDFVSGELTSQDAIDLVNALIGDDELKKRIARSIINNPNMTDEEKARLMELLRKENLTEEDLAEIERLLEKYPGRVDAKSEASEEGLSSDLKELKGLEKEITEIDAEISQLEKELEQDRDRYEEILRKQLNGEELSAEELAFMENYLEKQRRLKALKAKRKMLLAKYAALSEKIKQELITSNLKLKKTLSGSYIETDSFLNCADIESIVTKEVEKRVDAMASTNKKRRVRKQRRKLTPEEMRILGLENDNEPKMQIIAMDDQTPELKADSFFILEQQDSKGLKLPPSLKIKAVLEDNILVSSAQPVMPVNIRILQDIRDPMTNDLVITKNSIASGVTQAFDENTGSITVQINAVTNGYKVEDISLTVLVPGKSKSTRGKILTEAIITEVAASASQFLRTQAQNELQDATTLVAAISAGGANATSGVAETIAQFLAEDLKNAPAIFFSPKGVRLILRTR